MLKNNLLSKNMSDKYSHERKIILDIINENYERFMQKLDHYLDDNLPDIDERKRAKLKLKYKEIYKIATEKIKKILEEEDIDDYL